MNKRFLRPTVLLLSMILLFLCTPWCSAESAITTAEVTWLEGQSMGSPFANEEAQRGKLFANAEYAVTEVFTVPKKGTVVTWTDASSPYADKSICVISSWKKDGSDWVFDADGALFLGSNGDVGSCTAKVEKRTRNGAQYTYVTSKDNENLRICSRTVGEASPKITLTLSSKTGYWDIVSRRWAEIEDHVPVSDTLGVPLIYDSLQPKWYRGVVAETADGGISDSDHFIYTEPIYIEKKGTEILFYDDLETDYAGGSNFSGGAYAVSVWKKDGELLRLDAGAKNQNGSQIASYYCSTKLKLRCYSYVTEEDDIYLRLCYRAATPNPNELPKTRDVLLIAPSAYEAVSTVGSYQASAWKPTADASPISYEICLPQGYSTQGERYPLVLSIGGSHRMADAVPGSESPVIGVKTDASLMQALQLAEELLAAYRINPSFIYFVGDLTAMKDYEKKITAMSEDAPADADAAAALSELLSKQPKVYYDFMEELTMYAIGDSYFYGSGIGTENAWPSLLAAKYEMHSVNYGRGSNTIAMCAQAESSEYYTPMCRRYTTMEDGDADIILLEGGRNDRSQKIPFGENDSTDEYTFKGAINLTVKGLKEKYPNALIVCITAWNYLDVPATANGFHGTTNDYATAMCEVVAAMNDPRVVCIHAADPKISGVDMNIAPFRSLYCISPGDISHLNKDGMKLVLPNFEQQIAKQYAIYKGLDLSLYDFPMDAVEEPVTPPDQGGDDLVEWPEPDAETTVRDTDETPAAAEEKGCGSTVGAAALPAAAMLAGAALLKKKKKKD